ncbi:MAG: LpqB family beta-propeller domain-containing protein [Verrucomicrobiae bacterium]|nr:LpqB family beta-propeller domain-containing protein [Verrucomicrobiae bacterium]
MSRCKVFVALVVVACFGCRVEERMVWSPDGSRAAVVLPHGLCLMDAAGKVVGPISTDVVGVSWLANGRGLVVAKTVAVTRWAELGKFLPVEEVALVESLGKGLLHFLCGAAAVTEGDVGAIEQKVLRPLQMRPAEPLLSAVVLYVRDTRFAEMQRFLQAGMLPSEWGQALRESKEVRLYELSVLELEGKKPLGEPIVIERSLELLTEPRVSPDGKWVGYLRAGRLMVAPTDGGASRLQVAEKVVGSFDWTRDSKALVYAVCVGERWEENALNLVRIERREASEGAGAPVLLASAAVGFQPRVRCLPDGRVLFASLQGQLPMPGNATNVACFYVVDGAGGIAQVQVSKGTLPSELGSFAVSPDGQRVAVVESGSDAVVVLDMRSGAAEVVSPRRTGRSRTLPAWRNADELYFAALPRDGALRAEWLRWRVGAGAEVVSGDWPGDWVKNLVETGR